MHKTMHRFTYVNEVKYCNIHTYKGKYSPEELIAYENDMQKKINKARKLMCKNDYKNILDTMIAIAKFMNIDHNPVVIQRQKEQFVYTYNNNYRTSSRLIKRNQFLGKHAEEKYRNRYAYNTQPIFIQEYYNNYYELYADMKDSYRYKKNKFVNAYEVINFFEKWFIKDCDHKISEKRTKEEIKTIKENVKNKVIDRSTYVQVHKTVLRQNKYLRCVYQLAYDYDIVVGYNKNGKAIHYTKEPNKIGKIEAVEELLKNDSIVPTYILRSYNGCQPRYALDTKYFIVHNAKERELAEQTNRNWLTYEGYKNLQLLAVEYFDYKIKLDGKSYLDRKGSTLSTSILRQAGSIHYKNDNKRMQYMTYSYVCLDENNKINPEKFCDYIIENCQDNQLLTEMAELTKKNLRTYVEVKTLLDRNKAKKSIPQKLINSDPVLKMIQDKQYKKIVDKVRTVNDQYLTFDTAPTYLDVKKSINQVSLDMILNQEAIKYASKVRGSISVHAKVETNDNGEQALYEPINNRRYDFLRLMAKITDQNENIVVNEIIKALGITTKYEGRNPRVKNVEKMVEYYTNAISDIIANKKMNQEKRRLLKWCLIDGLNILQEYVYRNYNHENNEHLNDNYVSITQSVLKEFIKVNTHHKSYWGKKKSAGNILLKALSAVGIISLSKINRNDICIKHGNNPNIFMFSFNKISPEQLFGNIKKIFECEEQKKVRKYIFKSCFEVIERIREIYGDEIYNNCLIKTVGVEVVKKNQETLTWSRQYQSVGKLGLTQHTTNYLNKAMCKMYSAKDDDTKLNIIVQKTKNDLNENAWTMNLFSSAMVDLDQIIDDYTESLHKLTLNKQTGLDTEETISESAEFVRSVLGEDCDVVESDIYKSKRRRKLMT